MWDNSFGGARAILILCSAEQLVMVGKRDEKTIMPFSFFSSPVSSFYMFIPLRSCFLPCAWQMPF